MYDVPIGIQDFRELRELDAYYVDKTRFIDSVLKRRTTKVFLFTRPRRFGKSLNISMLDAYVNIAYKGNRWFDGLEIEGLRPDDPIKNSFPVIYLDMKELSFTSKENFISDLRLQISGICKMHPGMLDSDRIDYDSREIFRELFERRSDETLLKRSLRLLSVMMEAHYGCKAVILIDEYDNPLNNSYGTPEHQAILGFCKEFFNSALKGNPGMQFAVVTGVMQISNESIFSGLNNLLTNNIFSTDMDEMFGFTEAEVRKLFSDVGHPEKYDEAMDWYDGYRFGNADVYNPWSLLNYVNSGFKSDAYWAGTSGNGILSSLLSMRNETVRRDLLELGRGGSIILDLDPKITFASLNRGTSGVYSVLALSGYLTARPSHSMYELSIPNREMYRVFSKAVLDQLNDGMMNSAVKAFSDAVLSGDAEAIGRSMKELLIEAVSGKVLDRERSYQMFMAGLLTSLFGNYDVKADFESGLGYYDIIMRRMAGNGPNVVIELKKAKGRNPSEESMTSLAVSALRQIHEREYYHGLRGETLLYGIAFKGKVPTVVSEELLL